MKELSLNILDIAQNSVKAQAKHLTISLEQSANWLTVTITDDGVGMSPAFAAEAANPFTTTRTTWTTMHQIRKWRTMSCTFFRAFSI